jgi:hypothetical protein
MHSTTSPLLLLPLPLLAVEPLEPALELADVELPPDGSDEHAASPAKASAERAAAIHPHFAPRGAGDERWEEEGLRRMLWLRIPSDYEAAEVRQSTIGALIGRARPAPQKQLQRGSLG